jgi:hypothetical protein
VIFLILSKYMQMKKLIFGGIACMFLGACQESETAKSDFTGNETTYALLPGSQYAIDGTVTFKEKLDGNALVVLQLSGTEGNVQLPVHLHLGDIASPGADVAALLNPVAGETGKSETTLLQLADESSITYKQLIGLDACIKVHLAAAGPDKDIILAGGNIGTAASDDVSAGRLGFGACQSE